MRGLLSKAKRWLRRQRERYLPDKETRVYQYWIARRINERRAKQYAPVQAGLFSILSAVWNGSPAEHFARLALTIRAQNENGACEWVICDNGCKRPELTRILKSLGELRWVRIVQPGGNAGILRGLRLCLEAASGRYVVPIDADDDLHADALRVAAEFIRAHGYPALLYSDEDKVIGTESSQPYFKPDFDPVLLTNSAYTAHLDFIDREKALALGAYTDAHVEGSVDWDLFLRFLTAGHAAVHIPEMLYRWRIHDESTAADPGAKDYIGESQRTALRGFLARHPHGEHFSVVESELLPGGAHFRLLRSREVALPRHAAMAWQEVAGFPALQSLHDLVHDVELVFLCDDNAHLTEDWLVEASGIFELFDDVAVVGGRLISADGRIADADQHFGFGELCSSPNAGRKRDDPGYFGQMFKQRSASAVSAQVIAVRREFLQRTLETLPAAATPYFLGAWLGAQAREEGRRVVYSPYITAEVKSSWSARVTDEERHAFMHRWPQAIPDRRFYPEPFSLTRAFCIEGS